MASLYNSLMDPLSQNSTSEETSPHERIALEQLIEKTRAEAATLLKEGSYKEALRKFKWVFSQARKTQFFLSTSDISRLLKGYPPAKTVIQRWRNDKEKLLLEGKFDLELVAHWLRLNSCLKEEKRNLEVYRQLEASGADERLLKDVLNGIWTKFVRARDYNSLRNYLKTLGFHIIHHAIDFDSFVLFPDDKASAKQRRWTRDYNVNYMLKDGIMSYEVALGLREKKIAQEFATKILGVECSDRVYAGLVHAAIRAKDYDAAEELFLSATDTFTTRRLRKTLKEITRLPKARYSQLRNTLKTKE